MKIVHISDTHSKHEDFIIPKCDVLVHTGDIGVRTDLRELLNFLVWFEKQPADKKIFCAGNHDIVLDEKWVKIQKNKGSIEGLLARQHYDDAIDLIKSYNVEYLMNEEYVYEGIKFYGSPYSCSFHRDRWVFNADRGVEIAKQWSKIPSDVNVLLTHNPAYGILDYFPDGVKEGEKENNLGCVDLLNVIKKRLFSLKLHCSGHIHDNYGVIIKSISNARHVMFSNGAMITNEHKQLIKEPFIITI